MARWLSIALFFATLCACSGDEERYEQIKKLRTIGAQATPLALAPSTATAPQIAGLNFVLAIPTDDDYTISTFVDESSKYALTLPITIDNASATRTALASFDIISIPATMAIPIESAIPFFDQEFVRFRYGVTVKSGGEEEIIVGNILVYKSGSTQLAWQNPVATISTPTSTASKGAIEIKGDVEDTIDEPQRISWFVGVGEVTNRRAIETKWQVNNPRTVTLVFSSRGRTSGGFSYQALDIEVK